VRSDVVRERMAEDGEGGLVSLKYRSQDSGFRCSEASFIVGLAKTLEF
jgi:hypothetical protein